MNARTAILAQYKVDERGRIKSPGKFEGEMLYVPYFYDCWLDGQASRESGNIVGFDITRIDRDQFPELGNRRRTVKLMVRDDGFVVEMR